MKKILLLFVLCCSCKSTSTLSKFDYNHDSEAWITAFKDQMFFACLKESHPNDTIFNLISKRDAFNPYEGLGLTNSNKAKELGKKIIQNIPPPKMCEGCKDGKNYYMANCLHYYKSKDLDSIANSEYKKFITQQKELYGN